MILLFGGTTEGRMAAKLLGESGKEFIYSTRTLTNPPCVAGMNAISGTMDAARIAEFCRQQDVRLIIDAAHPFAGELHGNIAAAAGELCLPVIRLERRHSEKLPSSTIRCKSFAEAETALLASDARKIVALTGVRSIARLKRLIASKDIYFRILDRPESLSIALSEGVSPDHLLFYEEDSECDHLFERLQPDAVVLKESGDTSGMEGKAIRAAESGATVYTIRHAPMPTSFIVVDGTEGLRKEIERIMPDFFPLRSGYTTGTCAAAATHAALMSLTKGVNPKDVKVELPSGEHIRVAVESTLRISGTEAEATIVKYAGDDPDVTDQCHITARVAIETGEEDICITGGEGVGRVTLPGLGIPVGEAAINAVPQTMIRREVERVCGDSSGGVSVEISVAEGRELASRTFNPRLGIEGGISIIGTTGIVRPLSHEAFIETIRRGVDVAVAAGAQIIVLNSGGRSERFVRAFYPDLPPSAFIHYGNAVGEAVGICKDKGVRQIALGLMAGKAVKLAEGNLDTHSHKVTMNREFLCRLALEAGCSEHTLSCIKETTLARNIADNLDARDSRIFFDGVLKRCREACASVLGDMKASFILLADDGRLLARSDS